MSYARPASKRSGTASSVVTAQPPAALGDARASRSRAAARTTRRDMKHLRARSLSIQRRRERVPCRWHPPCTSSRQHAMEAQMEERTTTTRRTTVVPDEVDEAGSTNINFDTNTGATTIQENDPAPRERVVRETTTEKTTRS